MRLSEEVKTVSVLCYFDDAFLSRSLTTRLFTIQRSVFCKFADIYIQIMSALVLRNRCLEATDEDLPGEVPQMVFVVGDHFTDYIVYLTSSPTGRKVKLVVEGYLKIVESIFQDFQLYIQTSNFSQLELEPLACSQYKKGKHHIIDDISTPRHPLSIVCTPPPCTHTNVCIVYVCIHTFEILD